MKEIRDESSVPESGRSPGGRHGNPLQCSCLENPMDRGAWWATVHRVAKSQTWLEWLSMQAYIKYIYIYIYVISNLHHINRNNVGQSIFLLFYYLVWFIKYWNYAIQRLYVKMLYVIYFKALKTPQL